MKKKKVRVELRKDRDKSTRSRQPRDFGSGAEIDLPRDERISGKGALTRRRTIVTGSDDVRNVDLEGCVRGRVLSPRGTGVMVRGDDGRTYECVVRRLVKSLSTDARTAVVAGDLVWLRPGADDQGAIERVEPRKGTLSRRVRGQRQVLVANVDCVLIVASAADPPLKPSLIDRYLITAARGGLRPIVCLNKADLVDPADLQPVAGLYSQLGYDVVVTSVQHGRGISRLRHLLTGKQTVLSGQSGVGKSSLINAVQPGLNLRTLEVSEDTGKGRHTTTSACLLELGFGGWVVDTPGIRSFELADVAPEEVEDYFIEFRPFTPHCRFPGCSHIHETQCAVKRAVADRMISVLRFESYCRIRLGDPE